MAAYKFFISERKVLGTPAYIRSVAKYSKLRYIICKLVDSLCSMKTFQLARPLKLVENFTFFFYTEGIRQQTWVLSSMLGTIDI
jgi:hypothetical protein